MGRILITHFYYGYPSEEFSLNLAKTLINAGADMLEIGIPYTDPVCDGEVFQRACQRALEMGMTPLKVLAGIKKLRRSGIKEPIYLTSYYAPIFKIGVDNFVQKAEEVGITGLIVPDLLLEEQEELREACIERDLSLIQFAIVYSSMERLKQIMAVTADFVYCISLPGVTGDQGEKSKLPKLLMLLKSMTDKRILVGFGIESVLAVKKILSFGADGVIVGSSIARIYEEYINNNVELSLAKISRFVKSLKACTV